MKQSDSQPVLHVCQGPGHLFARCGVGDAGDEVMNEILNREEPELQWMRWIGEETDHYVVAQAQCRGGRLSSFYQ